ncbi:Por secretion system C-terminal sorting domain-containing protein [Halpernia humi]|uniref:Por secretion system C-terminal sorting domain-containing protein n=1 Tax=Halpernia humi TaxID=493375 RepID=A0A1H5WIJ8_9FLAO|nr:zinc-dependent metalloprotease family protein [Halpernia humi]SEF99449.1 Por secretion system C-terminal sorting domain-containing protein [Halpernia humi]
MKKYFTTFLLSAIFANSFAQWSPVKQKEDNAKANSLANYYYTLDINQVKSTLKNAEETGKGAKPVIINMPTLDGKIEKFAVYSFPVMVKSLAEQYHLGSYVGVGIDDPSKYIRFSVAPNNFQSMIIQNGKYQFIEPEEADKTIYRVHAKTINTGDRPFLCGTKETPLSKEQLNKLFKEGNNFSNQPTNFSKSSDRKYRTMRLAISVTGEYTTYFGSVAKALAQINATMTRVNAVFENDFALHLNVQNFPQLIYTNPATDPYSPASSGANGNWNGELMNTLHSTIGDAAFDIGHLFGASGGGGNAGCIGCVCNNTLKTGGGAYDSYKGSGFTSPADGKPLGDTFDIDYVAHEMGHQLGGNHTFSYNIEGTGVNIEPGSGSTIMGYAGITGPLNDVQPNSDPYFSIATLIQVQNNLVNKTCDVETSIPNNPPLINALASVTIPKLTPFVLTAEATDPESDPMTYCWEEYDDALEDINISNLGNTTTGASFRSLLPTTNPVRYFPRLSTVLAGNIKNSADWEAVSTVPRLSKYTVTVRDNNSSFPGYQQTQYAQQNVTVGNEGPFAISSTKVYNNAAAGLTWDVVKTNAAPYNVANVKIDYTTDNGANWTVISASTPNDGAENLNFAPLATGTKVKVRISALNNVFYTIKELTVSEIAACTGVAPSNIVVGNISTESARISWDPIANATYSVRYRKIGTVNWTVLNSSNPFQNLDNLDENTQYEVQVATSCSGTVGAYSTSNNFNTLMLTYCTINSGSSASEYISNVTVTSENGTVMNNTSSASTYSDYTNNASKLINLIANTTNNTLSVTKTWQGRKYGEAIFAWIDFNRDGNFDASEQIMASSLDLFTPVQGTFSVPANAYTGNGLLRMRVILTDNAVQATACSAFSYGEVEDYNVKISPTLAVNESTKNNAIEVYPNPTSNILNITNNSENASYSVYNVIGQMVAKGKVVDHKVNVSNLEKGVYIISIDNKNTTEKVKFIKK